MGGPEGGTSKILGHRAYTVEPQRARRECVVNGDLERLD